MSADGVAEEGVDGEGHSRHRRKQWDWGGCCHGGRLCPSHRAATALLIILPILSCFLPFLSLLDS